MRTYLKFLFVLFLYTCSLFPQTSKEITAADLKKHLYYLASDEMKGRLSGSKEIYEAAKYIAKEYESYGLKPLFSGSYFQEYNLIQDVKLTKDNSLKFSVKGKELKLDLEKDFMTATFSGNGNFNGKIVFAGYGISAPKLKYDDYSDIDVKGKVVVVLRGTPEYDNPHSDFDKYSAVRNKASVAKEKGALGIIFINGYFPADSADNLIKFKYDRAAGVKDLLVLSMKRKFADELFNAEGLSLSDKQKTMKEGNKTGSFEFKNSSVELSAGIEELNVTDRNVGAILEGNDPVLKNEYVVIGAHFDHLGMGIEGSLYKGTVEMVHNGADDNASGTVSVLELAQKFASEKGNKRSIIFVNFSGEELGMLGSTYFVNNPPVPIESMITMVNLDMVGRLNAEKQLTIYGTGTSKKWKDLLNSKNTFGFKFAFNDEGYGPSDQTSFYAKKIPVLFYFTGVHTDYHRPSDDADLINYEGEEAITKFVYETTKEIIGFDSRPDYVDIPRKETSGGWKVYVGTIPDYSSTGEGFRLNGVSPGSPAEKGGLKGGDIMIQFGNKKINNIYDYVYALQDHVPGDLVEVTVKRNTEEYKCKIVLGAK